jgi:SAM-dependent methyltransferase
MKDLEFTGERVIPGKVDEALWYEHMARYIFAADFVINKSVLDAGCGSGYGANFLACQGAKYVLGVDISPEAIAYAREHYHRDNLEYQVMDVTNLELDDKTFDVVVAFEVIEHLQNQEKFLAEIARVLRDDGLFIISTPNREIYRLGLEPNPFHTKEFNFEEFYKILKKYFYNVKIFAQNYFAGILIAPVFDNLQVNKEVVIDNSLLKGNSQPLYFVALCSQSELLETIHVRKLIHFSYDRDEYLGKIQAEFEDKLTWALRLNKEVQRLSEELVRREERLSALEEGLANAQESITQQAEALRHQLLALQESLLWFKARRISRKLFWPLIGIYHVIRPFWKLRNPPEGYFRRVLIVGSASKSLVFKVTESLLRRFPYVRVTVLVRDDLQDELRERWPLLETVAINKIEYKRNPLMLLRELWHRDFDLAVMILSGEAGFYKYKIAGFLSGACYLMIYNENIDSFYCMLGQSGTVIQHLLWRLKLGKLRLNLRWWLSYILAPVGYLVVFVEVLPKLGRAMLQRRDYRGRTQRT